MNRHLQRVIGLIMFGVLVAGALVGAGWRLGRRRDRQPAAPAVTTQPTTGPPEHTTRPTPTGHARVGTWQRLPAAPIPGGSYAGVWTGTELLLHAPYFSVQDGRDIGRSVGADYNPTTRTWRNLPPAPGPLGSIEGGYRAVWSGHELLDWGMGLDAADDRAANRWTPLATGTQMLVWGGTPARGADPQQPFADGAAYTPNPL